MVSHRWWTTGIPYIDILYLPYTLMAVSYVIIGGLSHSNPKLNILLLIVIGWFIAVGIVAHAIDEKKGHPLNTGLSNEQLDMMAVLGLTIDTIISLYLALTYTLLTIPFFLILAFMLVLYNAELFEGRFHRDMMFTLGFAIVPMFVTYFAMTLSIPDLSTSIFFLGVGATASIETVVNHFVKFQSKDYRKAYDKEFAYLQRAVWATVFIVYMIAISMIVKHLA